MLVSINKSAISSTKNGTAIQKDWLICFQLAEPRFASTSGLETDKSRGILLPVLRSNKQCSGWQKPFAGAIATVILSASVYCATQPTLHSHAINAANMDINRTPTRNFMAPVLIFAFPGVCAAITTTCAKTASSPANLTNRTA